MNISIPLDPGKLVVQIVEGDERGRIEGNSGFRLTSCVLLASLVSLCWELLALLLENLQLMLVWFKMRSLYIRSRLGFNLCGLDQIITLPSSCRFYLLSVLWLLMMSVYSSALNLKSKLYAEWVKNGTRETELKRCICLDMWLRGWSSP